MKKQVLSVILILLYICAGAQSWERSYAHHDIRASFGTPAPESIQKFNSGVLNDIFPEERYVRDSYSGTGVVSAGYRYIPKSGIVMFGVSGSYHTSSAKIYNVGQYIGILDRQCITVAGDFQYRYKNLNKVQLYSGLSIGYTVGTENLESVPESGIENQSGSISSIAWQINAIGMRVGGDFGGFFEVGYGYKGIINLGISYQIY